MPATSISLPSRYRVSHHIASGGMASVWAATDELLNRQVAVKVLAAHLTQDETARVRFQREARAAAGLSGHPHVVTIFDVGEFEGRSFIVMELMSSSVADVLRSGTPVEADEALRWLRAAASALDAAHEAGIVHRDVKPANMLLDRHRRLALADFGIARLAYESQVTETGVVLGTATYISPEQALGEAASAASDIYALAAVAFELLTGGRPFPAEHFAAQARAHIEDPVPQASLRQPSLPAQVDPVLTRGLAKQPAERWPTAEAFVSALETACAAPAAAVASAGEPTRVMTATEIAAGRTPAPAPTTGRVAGEPAADATSPSRRWPLAAAAVAVIALALAAGAFALTGGGDSDSDEARAERRAARQAARAERTPTPTPTRTSTPTPTSTATPRPAATTNEPEATPAPATPTPAAATPAPTPATPAAPAPATVDLKTARANNDVGYSLQTQGRVAESLAPLQTAVASCGRSNELDPCGFALFNYAVSLRRTGRPAEAVPLLEDRLARFDFRRDAVRAELARARAEADQ